MLHRHSLRAPSRGFTLTELLVTVVILGIVVSYAAPTFTRMIATNRIAMQTNEFSAALKQARAEAIRRGHAVALRAADSADVGDFAVAGWTLLTDEDADGVAASPATDRDGTVIREMGGAGSTVVVARVDRSGANPGPYTYALTELDDDDKRVLIFNARGGNGSDTDAYFRVCDSASPAVNGRILRVSVIGTVTLAETEVPCT